jgi:hypothetical protein
MYPVQPLQTPRRNARHFRCCAPAAGARAEVSNSTASTIRRSPTYLT